MSIDRFTLHSRSLGALLLFYFFFGDDWRGWGRPLDVQGSGLEGTVGAEIGDQRGGAKPRSAREAEILLVIVALKQQVEFAVAIGIGILRLTCGERAAVLHPLHRRAKTAAGRGRDKEAVVVRLQDKVGDTVASDIGVLRLPGGETAAVLHPLHRRGEGVARR